MIKIKFCHFFLFFLSFRRMWRNSDVTRKLMVLILVDIVRKDQDLSYIGAKYSIIGPLYGGCNNPPIGLRYVTKQPGKIKGTTKVFCTTCWWNWTKSYGPEYTKFSDFDKNLKKIILIKRLSQFERVFFFLQVKIKI